MTVLIGVGVRQFYLDDAPEDFGTYLYRHGQAPKVGDVIQLKWLDGSDAYKVHVIGIRESDGELRVKTEDDMKESRGGFGECSICGKWSEERCGDLACRECHKTIGFDECCDDSWVKALRARAFEGI